MKTKTRRVSSLGRPSVWAVMKQRVRSLFCAGKSPTISISTAASESLVQGMNGGNGSLRTPDLLRDIADISLQISLDTIESLKPGFLSSATIDDDLKNIKECSPADIEFDRDSRGRLVEIGSGGFGTVFLATHRPTGDVVAVKMFKRKYSSDQRIRREAAVLGHLAGTKLCPEFYGLVDYGADGGVAEGRFAHLAVVTELVRFRKSTLQCFDLKKFSQTYFARRGLTPQDWLNFSLELVEGVQEIHEKGVGVFDLKYENIMVTRDRQGAIHPRIVDFGAACALNGDKPMMPPERFSLETLRALRHDSVHLAPEIFEHGVSSAAWDVYSLGHVLQDLAEGEKMEDLKFLMGQCVADDPALRPSLALLLQEMNALSNADMA
ncbi:mitogen-activated protein kinase kinase kinase 21 [Lingula anatina]|uniref:Mitogen-activated protein kinase kinase kinase 21 n=1 Tax=Lingula anatina TaxID=7574 RepID=A0A1S3ICE2_LINAN|nr:mitogen-activated protein kinase kinase kinase 21 [Lingula anatina]|eukprot:XP_013395094.1 mitogen-activated protein kinase kinase kinase 21 [Lingula anatina]